MLLSYSTRLARPMIFGPEMYRCYYAARQLRFSSSACTCTKCALPFKSITVTFDYPGHVPSSTTAYKSDKPFNGDIKKKAIGNTKSANMPEERNFDLKKVNSSCAKYTEIAPLVNLDPAREFNDCPRSHQPRSRIPTALFKEVVMDMDLILLQYGPVQCHRMSEARSKFLAPILNRLLAQFGGAFRNTPGRVATKGKTVYHLKSLGIPTVVFVEMRNRSVEERLSAIAQIIAECEACHSNNNALHFDVPVYGILCDGSSYHFFSFDGKSIPPKFSTAGIPGSPFQGAESEGLPLVYFSLDPTARPFIDSLRPICETIFNILLTTFTASLKAHHDRAESQHREPEDRTLLSWYIAFKHAKEALRFSEDAESMSRNESITKADIRTEQTFRALKHSLAAVPIAREYVRPSLMKGWHDDV